MWPSYFAFAERYVKLTDKVTSIFSIVSSLFSLIAPFVLGPVIENHSEIMLNVEIGDFSIVIILFIIIMFVVKRSQRFPTLYTINH